MAITPSRAGQRDRRSDSQLQSEYDRLRMTIPPAAIQGKQDFEFSALVIGMGDARHLYSTLADVAQQLASRPKKAKGAKGNRNPTSGPKFHFTMVRPELISPRWSIDSRIPKVDINPTTVARQFVVLHLLDELAQLPIASEIDSGPSRDLLSLVFFV